MYGNCGSAAGGGPNGGLGLYSGTRTLDGHGGETEFGTSFQRVQPSTAQLSEGEILDVLGGTLGNGTLGNGISIPLPRPGLGGAPQQEGVDPRRHGLAVFRLMVCEGGGEGTGTAEATTGVETTAEGGEGAGTTVQATVAETTEGAGTTVQATVAETTQFEATTGIETTAEGAGTTVQATPMPIETTQIETTPIDLNVTTGDAKRRAMCGGALLVVTLMIGASLGVGIL